jgi:hypothetical protein
MDGQRLVWQSAAGETDWAPLDRLEFEQTMCASLHELFPGIRREHGGSIRLEPASHLVVGFMLCHDAAKQLWRVQHL